MVKYGNAIERFNSFPVEDQTAPIWLTVRGDKTWVFDHPDRHNYGLFRIEDHFNERYIFYIFHKNSRTSALLKCLSETTFI